MTDPSNQTDEELVRAIRQSDTSAFKSLYYRYYERLFRFLWRKTQDNDTAADLLQELFTRLWNNRETLTEDRIVKAYLYKIADNLAIDHLRKKAVRQSYAADAQREEIRTDSIEDFDTRDQLQKALNDLTEEQRVVFRLNRFEGLKYAEIAAMLGISIKAVEKRMTKALKTLRQKLQHLLIIGIVLKKLHDWVGFFGLGS